MPTQFVNSTLEEPGNACQEDTRIDAGVGLLNASVGKMKPAILNCGRCVPLEKPVGARSELNVDSKVVLRSGRPMSVTESPAPASKNGIHRVPVAKLYRANG